MKKQTVQLLGAVAILCFSTGSQATGYLVDSQGKTVRSGTDLCWQESNWTPAMAKSCNAPTAKPKKCNFSVTLSNDEGFVFGSSQLSQMARSRLDQGVVSQLGKCAKVDLVLVTGHTDRLGEAMANQALSEKRAEAVRSYLISKGIPADKVDTLGAGKTQQVKGCANVSPRQTLIDCLAPNRRVVVEVKGPAK